MCAISSAPIPVATRNPHRNDSDTIVDVLIRGDPVAAARVIGGVLGRAHRTAEDLNAPNEARAILHVAHLFADELAIADPQFDRRRFIQTVMWGRP